MTTAAQLRNRYARDSIATASPAKLVTMLYDRLSKDLMVAEQAVSIRDIQGAHAALMHAQEIVRELASSLDTSVWAGGPGLLALYHYVIDELVQANMSKKIEHIHNAREVIEPLREAWHQAAVVSGMAS